jgi:hypothetical protein
MGAQRVGQAGPPGGRLELAMEKRPLAQWAPQRRGEHEIFGAVGPPGKVRGQQLDQEPRRPHCAALIGLGGPHTSALPTSVADSTTSQRPRSRSSRLVLSATASPKRSPV